MLGFSNMLTVLTLCFLFSIGATFSSANFESKLSIEDPFAWLTGKTNEVSGMSEKISSNEFSSKNNSNFAEFDDAKGGVKKANSRRKRSRKIITF